MLALRAGYKGTRRGPAGDEREGDGGCTEPRVEGVQVVGVEVEARTETRVQ